MKIIPLLENPNQEFKILLGDQDVTMRVYQRNDSLYLDLRVASTQICTGQICVNGASLISFAQSGFLGSLHFFDLEETAAPQWFALGTRYVLLYYAANEELPEVLTW